MGTAAPASWAALMEGHHVHLRARNLAETTIRLYRYMIWSLVDTHPDPAAVTYDDLLRMLANPSWGPDGKKSARSAYRSFFTWAHKTGRLPGNPATDLPPIKRHRRQPRPTPEPVVNRSLTEGSERDRFMVELGALAGLRCCEIAVVHGRDWDASRRLLLVHGKGAKERLVPITDEQLVARLDALTGWAFPNRSGGPMTAGHVSVLLSRALAGTWTGHTLRHRFGTEALEETKDLVAVAEVMGHEQVETTRLYTKISDQRLVAVSRAARRRREAA